MVEIDPSFQTSLAKALGGRGLQLAAVRLEELTWLCVLTRQRCYEVTGWEALIGRVVSITPY